MGYFPNMDAWECWAVSNCNKCDHYPKTDEARACPVDLAHTLFNYDFVNDKEHPAKQILDMLIPPKSLDNERCAMFKPRHGVTEKHLKDWAKYKAIMAEVATPKEDTPDA